MGIIFKGPGILIYVVAGFWGLFICEKILANWGGTLLAVIGFFLFPALLVLAPWYQALFHGDWFPLLLVYGGAILGSILFGIGDMIDERMARR